MGIRKQCRDVDRQDRIGLERERERDSWTAKREVKRFATKASKQMTKTFNT